MKECAMLILAGGKSRRMGSDKARLKLGNKTFLEILIQKGCNLSVSEIYISGSNAGDVFPAQVHWVSDVYPQRGPLGGMHACFSSMESPVCLVLSVDVPQIPLWILQGLLDAHSRKPYGVKATLLCHHSRREPLIAVYDTDCWQVIEECIKKEGCPVFQVLEKIGWQEYEGTDQKEFLEEWMTENINTPEQYEQLTEILREKNFIC